MRPYYAYSPSGAVTGTQAVYYLGREEDYHALRRVGVDVMGCVAVVRRGEESRGGVVGRAAEEGAVAVLMYTKGESISGVERETVMKGLGDPLTPGWGGVEGGEALDLEDSQILNRFPKIPSMPISLEVAYSILRSLEGPQMPHHWRGDALGPQPGRVELGPTLLNFMYQVSTFIFSLFHWKVSCLMLLVCIELGLEIISSVNVDCGKFDQVLNLGRVLE